MKKIIRKGLASLLSGVMLFSMYGDVWAMENTATPSNEISPTGVMTTGIQEPESEPTPLPTATPEPTPEPMPEVTPTPEPTATPEPTPETTPTPVPEATSTPAPAATPTPEPTLTPESTPVPEATPTPSSEATPTPAPVDWSAQKDHFRLTFDELKEQDGTWSLSVVLSFPQADADRPVRKGDTASFTLPTEWLTVQDTQQPVHIAAYIEKNDGTEEKQPFEIGEYTVQNGRVRIRFTEDVETEAFAEKLTTMRGRLTFDFQWKENVRDENVRTETWVLQTYADGTENKARVEIPALSKTDETDDSETAGETGEPDEPDTPQGDEPDEKDQDKQPEDAEEPTEPSLAAAPLADIGGYTITNPIYTGASQDRHIYWIDNNNGQGTRPAFSPTVSEADRDRLTFSATFTYQDGTESKTVELNDLTWADVSDTNSTLTMTDMGGTGHWILQADNLLSGATLNIEGVNRTGTFSDWTINSSTDDHVFANDQYASVYVTGTDAVDQDGNQRPSAGDRRGWFYVQEMTYTSQIIVRAGSKRDFTDTEREALKDAILEKYSFFWKTGISDASGSDLNAGSVELESVPDWMQIQWDDSGEFLTGKVTVPNLEKYNLDGSELTFYIDGDNGDDVTITVSGMEAGDYFAESVENDKVSNWGTNITEVYSGGNLILTLTGTTTYEATKEWHDKADSSNRPQVDFYLWRFTDKGDDITTAYQTAAAVKATEGEHTGQTAQFTIAAKSEQDKIAIDFASNFTEATGYLPKYDPEGYRYVYLSREYMSGPGAEKYRTEYGALVNGDFEDTLPSGYTGDRTALDNSVYNGGTVSNLLTGTTTASVTKTWIANAFQSELDDVVVELTLYSKIKNDDTATWEPTPITYKMGENNPFIAEFLTQTHSITVNKYNDEGEELEFCWVETGVYQGGDFDNNLLDPNGTTQEKSFILSQKEQAVDYTSHSQFIRNADGTYQTDITNEIEDTTDYYVEKQWADEIALEDRTPVSLRIYRTGTGNTQNLLSTSPDKQVDFTLDGEVDDGPTPLYYNGVQVGQVRETEEWFAAFTALDKYDANGSRFDYIVFEGNTTTWRPQYSTTTDADGNTVRVIYNRPIPGAGQSILLRKRWLDDGDEQHRGTITFTIYEIPADEEDNITPELLQEDGVKIQTAKLDRSDEWWKQVSLDANVDLNRLLVLETEIAPTDSNGEAVPLQYTPEELQDIYALQHKNGASPTVAYETHYHQYEASYSMVDFEGNTFYTVTNRRLGNIDIEVTKTWNDGSADGQMSQKRRDFLEAIKNAGYELVFKLEATSAGVTIDYTNNTVTAGNAAVPIKDQNGNPAEAIQEISTNTNTSTYAFYNLPKYDENGHLVSYTVREMLRPLTSGELKDVGEVIAEKHIDTDYTFSMTQSGYKVEHGEDKHDLQTFSAVNALTGEKDVFFWKEWNDAYRLQRGERPDIYLSLYQVKHNADGTEKAPESVYLDRRWQFRDDWISLCDFGAMPKYDEYGFEIIYYAQEKILVNKEAFDYTDVYYKYSTQMEDKSVLAAEQTAAGEDLNQHVDELPKIGDETQVVSGSGAPQNAMKKNTDGVYLLKECGIFVNELQANIHISGKKIWANVDAGFPDADLPTVTFKLYRYHPVVDAGNIPDSNTSDSSAFKDDHKVAELTVDDWAKHKIIGEYLFELAYGGKNTNTVESESIVVGVVGGGKGTPLPKYDKDGYLYTYILRESADFKSTEAGDVGLVFKQPTINNYAITNAYSSVLGEISVKKILDLTNFNDTSDKIQNPSVSFTLTRSYKNAQGDLRADAAFQEREILKYTEFESGTATLTFENLELYAPNGSKYVYTVTEDTGSSELLKGGYTVYADNGEQNSVQKIEENKKVSVTGVYPRQTDPAPNPDLTPQQVDKSWATFENVYDKTPAPLYFSKNWVDGNNAFNTRLHTLTFDVKRSADAQPGQGNAIAQYGIGSMTVKNLDLTASRVELKKEDSNLTLTGYLASIVESVTVMTQEKAQDPSSTSDQTLKTTARWVFEVEFVDAYAPNSMPWKYEISEQTNNIAPYKNTSNKAVITYNTGENSFSTASAAASSTAITNSIHTTSTFWKNWRYDLKSAENFKNPFGYAMTLTTTLYAAGVPVSDLSQAPGENAYNNVTLWQPVDDEHPYWDELDTYVKKYNGSYNWNPSVSISASDTLGAKQGARSVSYNNLPTVIYQNGQYIYMRYYVVESTLTLQDKGQAIYRENFVPQFKTYSTVSGPYAQNGGVSRIGYWMETTAEIWNGSGGWDDTDEILVEPAVSSETILDDIYQSGLGALYNTAIDTVNDLAMYPFVNFQAGETEATAVNQIDLTKLSVSKTWENDNGNIYGTREPNGSGWKITFAFQRKDAKPDAAWETFTTQTMTGTNQEDTKTIEKTQLPVKAIVPDDAGGGYHVETYMYRAREQYDGTVIENTGDVYRETYLAAYTDGGNQADGYTTGATNTLQTVEFYAEKDWVDGRSGNLTFELKYTDASGSLQPFATPAVVELDGEQDAPAVYYEDSEWHAVWLGVPKVMPGSQTQTGVDGKPYTVYAVVEVSENAYQTGATTGTGTQNNPFHFENELTELRVEKTVEKYVQGAVVKDEFSFKVTGDFENITVYYQTFTKGTGGAADRPEDTAPLPLLADGTFTLSDNQYVILYGLKKGKMYTITETETHGYTPAFTVTNANGTTAQTSAEVTIPNAKAAETPCLTVLNQYFGKLTVEKKDENGNALSGVTFRLQVFDETIGTSGDWTDVKSLTTGTTGRVVFEDLELGKKYQILEDSVPAGYHKLASPIEIELPFASTSTTVGSTPLYTIGGTNYYAEVTVTVENNHALAMPTTSGEGFFWPGLVGLAVLAFGAGYGFFTGRRRRRKGA